MIRVCCGCKTVLGEKPPLEDTRITHGLCPDCFQRELDEAFAEAVDDVAADTGPKGEGPETDEYLTQGDE